MPVDLRLYPKNWKQIADFAKKRSNYCCEICGKQCYRPGEKPQDVSRSEWTKHIAQAHHKDFNPSNNSQDNIQILCPKCHLHVHKDKCSCVSPGQLSLF